MKIKEDLFLHKMRLNMWLKHELGNLDRYLHFIFAFNLSTGYIFRLKVSFCATLLFQTFKLNLVKINRKCSRYQL